LVFRLVCLRLADRLQVIILDDLGYFQQGLEEMALLLALLAEWYERRTVGITYNLESSEWNQIFKDPLTKAAAVDRIAHRSLIIELAWR